MAVANPCYQKEWDEWKKEMEEKRRRKLRERLSRWVKVKVNEEDEEEEDDGLENEDVDSEEEDVSEEEGKEENEAGWKGEEEEETEGESEQEEEREWNKVKREANGDEEKKVKAKEEHKTEEEKEEGESQRENNVKEHKKVDSEKKREIEETEAEDMEEINEEKEVEKKKVKREGVEEKEVKEAEELEEREEMKEKEVERGVKINKKVKEEDDREVKEVEEQEEGKKKVENEFDREVKENEEVKNEEGKEVTQGEIVGIGARGEVSENEVMVETERGVTESEQWEEEGGREEEIEIKINEELYEEEDREVKEEEQVEEEDDVKDEQPEQEQVGHYDLRVQFREHMNERRTENENSHQNQESAAQEDITTEEEDNISDSGETNNEDSDWMESEDESFMSEKIKNEESILGAWTSKGRHEEEDESEKPTEEEETVAESCTTHEDEFQDYQEKLQEEEQDSTDDEDAESIYEDVDNNEDVVKIYCKDDHPMDIFHTLKEFRESSILTDLNLSTEDGKSVHVHSPVLAAVSSLIWESLSRGNIENDRADVKKDDGTCVGINMWSVSLGPEVDHVGLEAVVEFAYSGLVSCLNKDTMEQIKSAAKTLGAPRVLDLCTEEESTKTGGQKKEERLSAEEQMMISLQSIKQLWMDRVGCDVILEAIGELLHVHRVILAASSDYFRGMFTLGMRESHQTCVTLPFHLASELEVLISCSYSGALPLSWRSVFEITSTALQLQYQPALSMCLNFLQQEINPHSCLDVASFAEAYEIAKLLEVADDFVLRQFQKVACTLKFKDLPAKHLLKYLNSHSLCVSSELVVFKAVVAWILAKPKTRLKLAKELMKTIHFPLMTFKEFKEVQSLNMWSDHSLVELYEAVFEDFCSNETASQSQCRIYLPKESLVLIGGDQISEDLGSRGISKELWFGNSLRNHTGIKKAMEWRKLGEMPEPARFSHEVAVLNGQLYVFGGKKYYGIDDTLNSVFRYDPHQNSWEILAEMQEKRCSFSVVVLDGKIYAIGGYCDPEYIDSVERYCPTANSWSFTWPMDLPLSGHVAKVLQGQIFVSGGLNSDYRCLASTFLYHPETGSTYLSNMTTPRAHHCMETLGDCLYVAGGITTDGNNTIVDQLACEVYNPAADYWTTFTYLKVPHVGAGSVVMEGKFYILGGYSQEDYSDTKMVHRYDPTTQRWENMGKMPGPNNDIRASLLCLPQHFRL